MIPFYQLSPDQFLTGTEGQSGRSEWPVLLTEEFLKSVLSPCPNPMDVTPSWSLQNETNLGIISNWTFWVKMVFPHQSSKGPLSSLCWARTVSHHRPSLFILPAVKELHYPSNWYQCCLALV